MTALALKKNSVEWISAGLSRGILYASLEARHAVKLRTVKSVI